MSRRVRSLPALALCAFLLAPAGSALGYLTTIGAGNGSTQLPTIVGPSGVSASQSGVDVAISWNAATLSSGPAVQGYELTRSDNTIVCGSPSLVTTLSCTDSGVPSGTYTYTVKAVYKSWDASATSASITILTAPTITAKPPAASNSTSANFSFSGGNGAGYQCQLDGGSYAACTSPASYSGLSQGSHTFAVRAANGSSVGPASSTYSWLVDTVAPTQALALAAGATGAYLNGSTLYYNGNVGGSFNLVDTVSDGGSGPASASYPVISMPGWTHAAETVTAPPGGPYTSSSFTWTAAPANPTNYSVTGADVAGNIASTTLSFSPDNAAPTGGALTVNGTAATAAGSVSQLTNSTSFTIGSRTDYTDAGSGLKSSVLTVQSESLSLTSTCGAAAGPFASRTTVTGTTQPSGIVAGYCYVYTLTGTDNVGNVASISTTVKDDALSFKITTQPASITAGVATSGNAVVLTAIKNFVTDTTYTGSALTWSGASNSPSGSAPTLPASPTWTSGQAMFGITLVKAETETLTVSDGTRNATFSPITVNTGAAAAVAWTGVSSPAGIPTSCFFSCTYTSGFGNGQTWSAYISITDGVGNTVSNIGIGHVVVVTLGGNAKGSTSPASPATLTIPSSGPATSATQLQYTSVAQGNYTDTLTATSVGYTSATASFSR